MRLHFSKFMYVLYTDMYYTLLCIIHTSDATFRCRICCVPTVPAKSPVANQRVPGGTSQNLRGSAESGTIDHSGAGTSLEAHVSLSGPPVKHRASL